MSNYFVELLIKELMVLEDSQKILDYSYKGCKKIGIKEQYTYEELDKFESLTSRFARTSDIIIRRIFRLIDKIELEDEGSVRDRINRAEKYHLIQSAERFIEIRKLRNDISHEYISTDIEEIFEKVLEFIPDVFDSINRIKTFCKKYDLEK
jgi:hypothetical protein